MNVRRQSGVARRSASTTGAIAVLGATVVGATCPARTSPASNPADASRVAAVATEPGGPPERSPHRGGFRLAATGALDELALARLIDDADADLARGARALRIDAWVRDRRVIDAVRRWRASCAPLLVASADAAAEVERLERERRRDEGAEPARAHRAATESLETAERAFLDAERRLLDECANALGWEAGDTRARATASRRLARFAVRDDGPRLRGVGRAERDVVALAVEIESIAPEEAGALRRLASEAAIATEPLFARWMTIDRERRTLACEPLRANEERPFSSQFDPPRFVPSETVASASFALRDRRADLALEMLASDARLVAAAAGIAESVDVERARAFRVEAWARRAPSARGILDRPERLFGDGASERFGSPETVVDAAVVLAEHRRAIDVPARRLLERAARREIDRTLRPWGTEGRADPIDASLERARTLLLEHHERTAARIEAILRADAAWGPDLDDAWRAEAERSRRAVEDALRRALR